MLESISLTHQGLVRERNEDSLICNESLSLWGVADGVGGNGHGDVASQLAAQTIERRVRQGCELGEALQEGNKALSLAIEGQGELAGMASTAVVCRFENHQFELAWVGDSRAYLLNNEGIYQLTTDHNVANDLFENGLIEQKALRLHPGQHQLTQALGQMTLGNVPVKIGELLDDHYLLLCTDGLTGVLSDEQIHQVVMSSNSLKSASDTLLQQVLDKGAPDNVTFALLKFHENKLKTKASTSLRDSLYLNYRRPFDKDAYLKHCKSRPMLLFLVLLSIVTLIFFI